jgi:hypothetical protein
MGYCSSSTEFSSTFHTYLYHSWTTCTKFEYWESWVEQKVSCSQLHFQKIPLSPLSVVLDLDRDLDIGNVILFFLGKNLVGKNWISLMRKRRIDCLPVQLFFCLGIYFLCPFVNISTDSSSRGWNVVEPLRNWKSSQEGDRAIENPFSFVKSHQTSTEEPVTVVWTLGGTPLAPT